ncbi:enoyl-CoA hydratase/isomerase family protein [Litorivivens sp.]|uniref:enoyl-CoA hydratase/isomerase family protein n=1 Tax=Litorivivens sp. TaxID=2020868 RepID=UPI0035669F7E
MNEAVVLTRHSLCDGGYIAQISLNAPQRINALNLEMVTRLLFLLEGIATDPEAVAVLLDGEGERGFCAGGDVRQLRASALSAGNGPAREAERFFEIEYRVDHLLHNFPKPVICWANGAIMGGGLGLMVGASHRIVTPCARLAMPEISIGLYPDVGATWFLQRMPGSSGLFCALTGVALNAGDALYSGLADYLLPQRAKPAVLQKLLKLDWAFEREPDAEMLTAELTDLEAELDECLPESHLKQRSELIDALCEDTAPAAIDEAFDSLHADDGWLNKAGQTFREGSASTARLTLALFERGAALSLADAFRLELTVSSQRVKHADFIEGVRARLIDKDHRPRWTWGRLVDVPSDEVMAVFNPPWDDHPLADLK